MLLTTAFADLPFVATLAAVLTLFAAPSIVRASQAGGAAARAEERRHTLAGAAVGLWVAVCSGYAAFAQPAWMLAYADSLKATPVLVWYPAFSLGLMASGAVGAWVSFACVARGHLRAARFAAGGWFFTFVLLFGATLPRALVAGTWAQFEAGAAPPLAAQPRLLAGLLLSWALAAAGLLGAFALRARSERSFSGPPG